MEHEMIIGMKPEKTHEVAKDINEVGKYQAQKQKMIVTVYYDKYGSTYLDKTTLVGLGANSTRFKLDAELGLYEVSKDRITDLIEDYKKRFPSIEIEIKEINIRSKEDSRLVLETEYKKNVNDDKTRNPEDELYDMLNNQEDLKPNETDYNDANKFYK